MKESEIMSYRALVKRISAMVDAESAEKLQALLQETEQLRQDNERLRLLLVKASRKSSMSSKLKDALYE